MTLCRQPVRFVGSSGTTNAATICPRIPSGCDGWRRAGENDWRELKTIPPHWMPFLNRERGTELDPRHTKE
jgi:hypothetical protein